MKLLLDTHTLVWWLNNNSKLSATARTAIADPGN
jgi:PIN domain nuclease of toxin-antitoxin system